jgi:hypothetical protein
MRYHIVPAILALLPGHAVAYLGPGAGLGAIATLVALTLGIILLIVGFLWFPLKRALRKKRAQQKIGPKTSSKSEGQ